MNLIRKRQVLWHDDEIPQRAPENAAPSDPIAPASPAAPLRSAPAAERPIGRTAEPPVRSPALTPTRPPAPARPAATNALGDDELHALIEDVRGRLMTRQGVLTNEQLRQEILKELALINQARAGQGKLAIDDGQSQRIVSAILGFGQLDQFLHDDSVTEVMIDGTRGVFIERKGRLEATGVVLEEQQTLNLVEKMVVPTGRQGLSDANPLVDCRLPDGSRVNAVHSAVSRHGTAVTIRKFRAQPYTLDDLVHIGSVSPQLAAFLRLCVKGRVNILVAGGTGSGKTTLLNVLADCIPQNERLVVIEDVAELRPKIANLVQLERRPANSEGRGEVSLRQLVINALRMRPDRIVVGECRGAEAFEMLQAMNTGHNGSLTTVHANTPREALSRLENMCLMSPEGQNIPLPALRDQIGQAIDLIIFQARRFDGARRVTHVVEVVGTAEKVYTTQELFRLENAGNPQKERLVATGNQPGFAAAVEERGVKLPLLVADGGR